jgi:hypothetical protein
LGILNKSVSSLRSVKISGLEEKGDLPPTPQDLSLRTIQINKNESIFFYSVLLYTRIKERVSKDKKLSKHIHTSFNLLIQRIGPRHPNPKRDKERGGGGRKNHSGRPNRPKTPNPSQKKKK